ncbi:hypothetical protein [Maridesulfovibrio sp.]|uniref:hypothetical protein n=1 Tax=Maridesulfovibrio sp. TaxID=2795000 RepID=UPI002A18A1BD|nr:hypothetical protein [Maridesulfovibrio sp.]
MTVSLIVYWYANPLWLRKQNVVPSLLIIALLGLNALTNSLSLNSAVGVLYILSIGLLLLLPDGDIKRIKSSFIKMFSAVAIVVLNFILICLPDVFRSNDNSTSLVGWFYIVILLGVSNIESVSKLHIKRIEIIISLLVPVLFLMAGIYNLYSRNLIYGFSLTAVSVLCLCVCSSRYYLEREYV